MDCCVCGFGSFTIWELEFQMSEVKEFCERFFCQQGSWVQ